MNNVHDKYVFLVMRIYEIAKTVDEEYPTVESLTPHENLWRIEQSILGTKAANGDCHLLIRHLRKQLGLSEIELHQIWIELKKQRDEQKRGTV